MLKRFPGSKSAPTSSSRLPFLRFMPDFGSLSHRHSSRRSANRCGESSVSEREEEWVDVGAEGWTKKENQVGYVPGSGSLGPPLVLWWLVLMSLPNDLASVER
ncbi:hypothetical protein EYF80_050533 [Liparis tanakae]|uniref:Uncharacterized protein n=1 Tax=Liparis tanakae TaxID=230148 RepID=A0A4Z2FE93_9TELE|nr:hypothetical protein EYF80_050533 [Liparis tanakae]